MKTTSKRILSIMFALLVLSAIVCATAFAADGLVQPRADSWATHGNNDSKQQAYAQMDSVRPRQMQPYIQVTMSNGSVWNARTDTTTGTTIRVYSQWLIGRSGYSFAWHIWDGSSRQDATGRLPFNY